MVINISKYYKIYSDTFLAHFHLIEVFSALLPFTVQEQGQVRNVLLNGICKWKPLFHFL